MVPLSKLGAVWNVNTALLVPGLALMTTIRNRLESVTDQVIASLSASVAVYVPTASCFRAPTGWSAPR